MGNWTRRDRQEIADECQEAIFHSAEDILGTLTPNRTNLILEVLSTAPTELYEQVAVWKDIAAALLRVSRMGGDVPEAAVLEGPTLHYLFHTLILVRLTDADKEVHLRSAKALEVVIGGIWARGVPSHLVELVRETGTSSARKARDKAAVVTNRLVNRAFRVLRASGEERQGYADDDNSTGDSDSAKRKASNDCRLQQDEKNLCQRPLCT